MKNQRRAAPQRGIQGSWAQRYQCPQKAHHIKEINSEKCAHCKPLSSEPSFDHEALREKKRELAQTNSEHEWAQKYRCAQKIRHLKEVDFEKCQHCKPHWYHVFTDCYNFVKRKLTGHN